MRLGRLTLLALLAGGCAVDASAETLAEAVALAYESNPTLSGQRFSQKALDEDYVQARSQYGPTLNVQATGAYQYQHQLGQSVDNDVNAISATLSQPLYTSGRLRGQLASARALVRAGQEQLRSVEQTVLRNVVVVYAAVIRDEARLQVGRENVRVLQAQLDQSRERRRIDTTRTDVAQSDARLAAAQSQLATLEQLLANSRGQYLQIVGRNPGTLAPLPPLGGLPATLEAAFEMADATNPDLGVRRFQEERSRATVAAVQGERGPTISATVQGIYTNDLFRFEGRPGRRQVNAGLTLNQNLFASGLIRSRVRQAEARNQADQAAIDESRRTALQGVTSAWSQLAAARTALTAGQRQVASAEEAYRGMQIEEAQGFRSTIDTLNAEQELQAAQLTLLQNRYNEYVARALLLQAMGVLDTDALGATVEPYDPQANFLRVRNKGRTPLEPVAQLIDRIGAAAVKRPPDPELSGADVPQQDRNLASRPEPTPEEAQGRVTPLSEVYVPLRPRTPAPGELNTVPSGRYRPRP